MSTATFEGPSRVEVQLLLQAAAMCASPREHGRQQARRAAASVVRGLAAMALIVAAYDVSLLVGAV